jgi:hypothetical protein
MFKNIKTAEQLAQEKTQAEAEARIAELKRNLAETDYVTLPDYDKDKPEVLADRQAWRDEIRALEEN